MRWTGSVTTFVKHGSAAALAWESTGLRWLAEPGALPVVRVEAEQPGRLALERLRSVPPDRAAAEALGHGLARLHAAGADAFGCAPPGWSGHGWFGPLTDPRPMAVGAHDTWGEHYAEDRLDPLLTALPRDVVGAVGGRLERVAGRLRAGAWDDDDAPARLHGDLWAGNVMWTPDGATLIDPAAHGGHRLTDLAMLDLFGLPYLEVVLAAYAEAHALPDGWRDLLGLHQIYPVGMHVVLFGGGYADQLTALLHRYA